MAYDDGVMVLDVQVSFWMLPVRCGWALKNPIGHEVAGLISRLARRQAWKAFVS
jgi:hypothetical protein